VYEKLKFGFRNKLECNLDSIPEIVPLLPVDLRFGYEDDSDICKCFDINHVAFDQVNNEVDRKLQFA
jgi:hypothetical protein